jgi:uncharacterized protein involved in exopolysaccharide biosynthesis
MDNKQIDVNAIDIKQHFITIANYKYMIIFLMLLFGFSSAIYTYFQPNEYKASAIVEVGLEQRSFGAQDILAMAMSPGVMNTDTEMEIIRSRKLSKRISKKVDFAHRYYTTRKFKEVELYKNSPFQVGMNKGFYISFNLYPVDEKHYRLVVTDAKDENKIVWSYDKILPYDKEIVAERFHLNVTKTGEMKDNQYRFVVIDPQDIGSIVQLGVDVFQKSKFATMLEITYADNVALRAQEATNALVNAYLKQSIERKTKEASLKLDFVDKQLDRITENLRSSAIKLEEFKRSANTVNLSAKAENIIRHMSESETKLEEITIQEEMLKTLYKQFKA